MNNSNEDDEILRSNHSSNAHPKSEKVAVQQSKPGSSSVKDAESKQGAAKEGKIRPRSKTVQARIAVPNDASESSEAAQAPSVIVEPTVQSSSQRGENEVVDLSSPESITDPEIGQVLGAYELVSKLGRGGMGSVFKARHRLLGREVAIKVLHSPLASDQNYVSRFFQEARVVNDVHHPNVVDIIDFIITESPRHVAFVMELLAGSPLSSSIRSYRFNLLQTVNSLHQLADALLATHAMGIVHRDLKPENVFVVAPLDSDLSILPSIKVLDFGIAKHNTSNVAHQTAAGSVMGTPAYMAPEQISAKPVSEKTDVYAVGEIFYEMLTGTRLFTGDITDIYRNKLNGTLPSFDKQSALKSSEHVENLIRWCLEVKPENRPTMQKFVSALEQIQPAQTTPLTFFQSKNLDQLSSNHSSDNIEPTFTPAVLQTNANALTHLPTRRLPLAILALTITAALILFLVYRGTADFVEPQSTTRPLHVYPVPTKALPSPPTTDLEKVPPAKAILKDIMLDSRPTNATVFDVDSHRPLGRTPLSVSVLRNKERNLRIERGGYQTKIVVLTFSEKSEKTVDLIPKPNAVKPTKRQNPVRKKTPKVHKITPAKPATPTKDEAKPTKDPLTKDEILTW